MRSTKDQRITRGTILRHTWRTQCSRVCNALQGDFKHGQPFGSFPMWANLLHSKEKGWIDFFSYVECFRSKNLSMCISGHNVRENNRYWSSTQCHEVLVLFVQIVLDINLIFRFLYYDQVTCIYYTTRVIFRRICFRSINKRIQKSTTVVKSSQHTEKCSHNYGYLLNQNFWLPRWNVTCIGDRISRHRSQFRAL